jgi:hypothetical protein
MAPFKTLTILSGCLALVACGGGAETNMAEAPANEAATVAEPANVAEANRADGGVLSYGEGDTEFRVSWPAIAAGIAPLNAILHAEAEELRKETETGLRAEQAASKEGDYPFRGYSYTQDWAVAADIPPLLILRSEGYTYTGGAHGMPLVDTLYWDKMGNRQLEVRDIFDEAALGRAVKDRFCKALDVQRAEKRGEPVGSGDPSPISDFDACVDPTKQTILPVATRGGALNMIHFVIMPYEAGPYSEGIYEIEVPVDPAVLNAVKPAWKSAFTAN